MPANLLAGVLTTALSWLAIAGAMTAWLPPLQGLVLQPAGWLIGAFLAGLDQLLKLPSPVLKLPLLATSVMLLAYLSLLLYRWRDQCRMRQVLCAGLLAMPLICGFRLLEDQHHCPVRVTFLAVGQGDAALIETPDRVMLVDAGPRWQTDEGWDDAGQRDILPYLQRQGIRRLDLVVISHPHLDHYGGLLSLIPAVPIGRIVGVAGGGDSPAYTRLLEEIQHRRIPFEPVHSGSLEVLAGEVKLIFWQPLPDEQASINDRSLAVQLIHRKLRFLLSGDLEAAGEAALLKMPGFEAGATILKVPHHGSSTSSTPDFLQAVHPAEAIVSVGARNKYHHPSADVLARYRALGIRVWRTDQNGAVCVCSQGDRYEVRTPVTAAQPAGVH